MNILSFKPNSSPKGDVPLAGACGMNMRKVIKVRTFSSAKEKPRWVPTAEESRRFVEWANLYFVGDTSFIRADDIELMTFGFIRENDCGKVEKAMMKLSELKRDHPELWEKYRYLQQTSYCFEQD